MRLPVLLCTSLLLTTNTASSCSLDEEDLVSNAVRVQLNELQPVTDELINKTYEYAKRVSNPYIYFQIYQGELYFYHKAGVADYRFIKVVCLLITLLLNENNDIPDTSFVISLFDGSTRDASMADTFPIFCFSRDRLMENAHHFILFPDDYSIGSGDPNDFYMKGLGASWKAIKKADVKPYSEKKKEIMWRGKNTGNDCSIIYEHVSFTPGCLDTPKMAAVNLSKRYGFLDCKFAAPVGMYSATDKHWGTTHRNVIDLKGKANYQKLLVIDGVRSTFPGFALSLIYNAVTLKVEGSSTKEKQQSVFHSQLVPYVHFYPIDSLDMEQSLRSAYAYLENSEIAEEMSRRSTQFAEEMLTPCALEKYVVLLLQGYEAKAKMGSRPPREGMKRVSKAVKRSCLHRLNNHARYGLYFDGALSANTRRPKAQLIDEMKTLQEHLQNMYTTLHVAAGGVVVLLLSHLCWYRPWR